MRAKGEKHGRWKGDKATKNVIHRYIEKRKPKPKVCEECGEERKLNLANIKNHEYTRDIKDYRWLCYSCHGHLDKNKEFCKNGHKLEGDNLIINNRGHMVCRECRKESNKKYRKEAGEALS